MLTESTESFHQLWSVNQTLSWFFRLGECGLLLPNDVIPPPLKASGVSDSIRVYDSTADSIHNSRFRLDD